jgi:ferredoxin-NADP reductase
VFWWGLWIAAAGAVLMWRIGQPLWRSLRHRLVVSVVVPEVDGCVSVHVTGRRLDALPARAGQFLIWRFLAPGWTRGHPYSLSAAPDGRSLRITVKDLGSGALRAVRPGTRVLVEGPYGRLTEHARTSSGVAMIGAGVGITPLRALAEELGGHVDVVLFHRYYRGEPLFADELATLARHGVVRAVALPGPRRAPGSWLGPTIDAAVDDLTALRAWVPDIAARDVYVCGPPDWTRLVQHTLTAAGVPDEAVHIENFGW